MIWRELNERVIHGHSYERLSPPDIRVVQWISLIVMVQGDLKPGFIVIRAGDDRHVVELAAGEGRARRLNKHAPIESGI
jgi:hypothetical protein